MLWSTGDSYQHFKGTCCLHLLPWWCRQQVPPRCSQCSLILCGVRNQKITI